MNDLRESIQAIINRRPDWCQHLVNDVAVPISDVLTDCAGKTLTKFTDSFRNAIASRMARLPKKPLPAIIQPPNCRVVVGTDDYMCVVIEQPPLVRTIFVNDEGESDRWRLSFPYVIFFPTFREGRYEHLNVAFMNKPIESMDDVLLRTGMPNMGHDFDNRGGNSGVPVFQNTKKWPYGVCVGFEALQVLNDDETQNKSVAEQCKIIQNLFWTTAWETTDPSRYLPWKKWQKLTERAPLDILQAKFKPGLKLGDALTFVLPTDNAERHIAYELYKIYDDSFRHARRQLQTDSDLIKHTGNIYKNTLSHMLFGIAFGVADRLAKSPIKKMQTEGVQCVLAALQEIVG